MSSKKDDKEKSKTDKSESTWEWFTDKFMSIPMLTALLTLLVTVYFVLNNYRFIHANHFATHGGDGFLRVIAMLFLILIWAVFIMGFITMGRQLYYKIMEKKDKVNEADQQKDPIWMTALRVVFVFFILLFIFGIIPQYFAGAGFPWKGSFRVWDLSSAQQVAGMGVTLDRFIRGEVLPAPEYEEESVESIQRNIERLQSSLDENTAPRTEMKSATEMNGGYYQYGGQTTPPTTPTASGGNTYVSGKTQDQIKEEQKNRSVKNKNKTSVYDTQGFFWGDGSFGSKIKKFIYGLPLILVNFVTGFDLLTPFFEMFGVHPGFFALFTRAYSFTPIWMAALFGDGSEPGDKWLDQNVDENAESYASPKDFLKKIGTQAKKAKQSASSGISSMKESYAQEKSARALRKMQRKKEKEAQRSVSDKQKQLAELQDKARRAKAIRLSRQNIPKNVVRQSGGAPGDKNHEGARNPKFTNVVKNHTGKIIGRMKQRGATSGGVAGWAVRIIKIFFNVFSLNMFHGWAGKYFNPVDWQLLTAMHQMDVSESVPDNDSLGFMFNAIYDKPAATMGQTGVATREEAKKELHQRLNQLGGGIKEDALQGGSILWRGLFTWWSWIGLLVVLLSFVMSGVLMPDVAGLSWPMYSLFLLGFVGVMALFGVGKFHTITKSCPDPNSIEVPYFNLPCSNITNPSAKALYDNLRTYAYYLYCPGDTTTSSKKAGKCGKQMKDIHANYEASKGVPGSNQESIRS